MIQILDRHTRGPRVRVVSERANKTVARIRALADVKLKEARLAYANAFGFDVKDKGIDREIAGLFSDALVKGEKKVQVPIHLVLALWLREGGAGRRVGPLSETDWSDKKRIVEKVRARKLALQAERYSAGAALERAANELSPGPHFPAEAIIERIRHPSGRHRSRNRA
jgi:hypothetical protein